MMLTPYNLLSLIYTCIYVIIHIWILILQWLRIRLQNDYNYTSYHMCDTYCMFDFGLSSHSRIVKSYWDVTITGEGLQILTYAHTYSWPVSSEGSLACHTYCDTVHPFVMVKESKEVRESVTKPQSCMYRIHIIIYMSYVYS